MRARRAIAIAVTITVVLGAAAIGAAGAEVGAAARRRAPRPASPCSPIISVIACENSKAGTPQSVWDVSGAGNPSIEGFATQMSVDHGQTVHFKIKTAASAYHLDIYRLGYYQGNGARLVATVHPSAALPQTQPACIVTAAVKLVDCGSWADSATWAVPSTAVSGIYLARLVRDDAAQGASHIVFVVRDDERHAAMLFQTSDSTWEAYNDWGGHGIYLDGAPKASYNRPFDTRTASHDVNGQSWVLGSEYAALRFFEANGYDVSYAADVDADRNPGELLHHRVYLSVGHDEYWSRGRRDAVEAARDAGVNLVFLSGNESYWKSRWENSTDASGSPYRTLVTYKEFLTINDPSGTWTGLWRDPRYSPPQDGGRPENAMSGVLSGSGGFVQQQTALQVPPAQQPLRFWRSSAVASTPSGQTATLAGGTVGYEFDQDLDNGSRPAGLMWLSSTPTPGEVPTGMHHSTLYRASSGALVFAGGSVQWAWGLDGHHDGAPNTPDASMRQAMINLVADMGVQPATLQSGLVAATPSTDHTAPTARVTAPANGATVTIARAVTISGTASDSGGGVVAGVEVSFDSGATWHRANGRTAWSYAWTPTVVTASTRVLARAVDDSANLGAPSAAATVAVVARACPCTIWSTTAAPQLADSGQTSTMSVGTKLRVDRAGHIAGVRFYKSIANGGTHVAHLWRADGTLLATATFTNETASGWQTVHFATPVPVAANTVYVVSYDAPKGHTAWDVWGFDPWILSNRRGVDDPPLHALWDRDPSGPNGLYRIGSSGFPTASLAASNFWVDAIFQ